MTRNLNALILFLIGFLSRLPFIFNGFGKEEDAWSQMMVIKSMSETGIYEISRLPGHPLFETIVYYLWKLSEQPWLFNGFMAFISALCVLIFYKILEHLKFVNAVPVSLAFNFIPVFFIAGTYTIDYNLALLLILCSWLQILRGNYILAGLVLGLATGVRISSIGFIVVWPFFTNFQKSTIKSWFLFLITSLGSAAFCYYLPLSYYGLQFIDFHKPPFPSITNIIYKLSIGIWGVPLLVFLIFMMAGKSFWNNQKYWIPCVIAILLQAIVFIRLPFKSEFFLPAIPFILLLLGSSLSVKQARVLVVTAIASCFLLGFDYANDWRGSKTSYYAINFTAGNKQISFHPLNGPVQLDQGKRAVKSNLVNETIKFMKKNPSDFHITTGWYYPELVFKTYPQFQQQLDYYTTEQEINNLTKAGTALFYLPEINQANAAIYNHNLLDSLAKPLYP